MCRKARLQISQLFLQFLDLRGFSLIIHFPSPASVQKNLVVHPISLCACDRFSGPFVPWAQPNDTGTRTARGLLNNPIF